MTAGPAILNDAPAGAEPAKPAFDRGCLVGFRRGDGSCAETSLGELIDFLTAAVTAEVQAALDAREERLRELARLTPAADRFEVVQ